MATSSKGFFVSRVYPKLLIAGHYSGCHQLPERSFFFGHRKYPVCARCLGVYVTFVPSLIVMFVVEPPLLLGLALIVPMIFDGFLQLLTSYESTNPKRLLSGLLFGPGLAIILAWILRLVL